MPRTVHSLMRSLPILALALSAHAGSLDESVRSRIGGFHGMVSLYAKNPATGVVIDIHGTDPVRTASTIKLPIVCAVFDAVAHGQAKWSEPLTVKSAEKVTGTGVIASEISDGVQLPLRVVVNLMMVLSDNTATNMILERFGADMVNRYLDRIGLPTTRVMRKILGASNPGWSTAGKLPENQKYGLGRSTPRDMVTILEKLERGEIVSPEASREILAILKRCQDSTGIRRRLGGTTVANKTGALDALRSDVGIVYGKTSPIFMAITVDGMPQPDWTPDNPGSLLIADVAKMLADGLAKK